MSAGWSYQVVQLNRVDTLVDTRDNLLGDSGSIDVLRVQAVTKPRHTGSDLVELHAFFASVYEIARQQSVIDKSGKAREQRAARTESLEASSSKAE